MPGLLGYLIALLVGFVLGGVFFTGLLVTVLALPKAKYPAALALGSLLVRSGLVVAGILFAMHGRWQYAVACLFGFTVARFVVVRWTSVRTVSEPRASASGSKGLISP